MRHHGLETAVCVLLACVLLLREGLPGASGLELLAAGASFPAGLYQDAVFAYQFVQPNVSVSYLPTGSSKGKCRIQDFDATCGEDDSLGRPHIDFAGSDSLLKDEEYEAYPDLQMLPMVAGSVVMMYNLPVFNSEAGEQLILNRDVLSKIFMGLITKWNDPAIVALQQTSSVSERLSSSDETITIAARADGSGTTEVFTKSLDKFSGGQFATQVGNPSSKPAVWDGALANGATMIFRDGTSALSAAILLTPWSIGYGSADAAAAAGADMAAFRQMDTQSVPVVADTNSVGFAMLENGLQFGNNGDDPERLTADLMDAKGGLAWPIATYTYAIIRDGQDYDRLRSGATCEHVRATMQFLDWFYTSSLAKQLAARNDFVALPELIVAPVVEKLRATKCGGQVAYIAKDTTELKIPVNGTIDGLLDKVFSFYSLSYQAVDEYSIIEYTTAASSLYIPADSPLAQEEGYRIVVGNGVYDEAWVGQELSKVIKKDGTPTNTAWSDLHKEGQPSSMVLPWFAMSLEFYANIAGMPEDTSLVIDKTTLGLILGGTITSWRSPVLVEANPWLADLGASDDDMAIKLLAPETKDSLYEYISLEVAPGFPLHSSAQKLKSYAQAAIVASGVPGALVYTASIFNTASSLVPLSILWPGSQRPVAPSYDAGMTCVTANGAFDPATLAFTADASVDGCYPLMLPVNFVFHHSFEDNEALCFRDLENQGNFGEKLPAVEFVKWIFESAQATESILTYMGAVPLTHATGDAKHIAAVLHVTDTINCGHEPNPVVLPLPVIIGVSVAGFLLLVACVGLAYWTVQERNEMKQNPLRGLNVAKEIEGVLEDVRPISEGKVATYIPELGHVDPRLFSIVIVDVKGKVYKCGNWGHKYSIQSMSKPFSYAFAIRERGEEHMKQCVGVEPAGGAFDTIEMDPHGRPFNPYINAGALAVTMQLRGDKHERYSSWAEFLGSYCGSRLELDKGIYESESSTAARNREIADKLIETGVCKNQYDKEHGLEAYFMQCSTLVDTLDLATMAATCANQGVNPVTKQRVISREINESMMSVMMTCGMYNGAGNWMVDVGIPAKSGVSGGIFGVVPGVCGLAVFSPCLDESFNSVRGIASFVELSQRMGLHLLQKNKEQLSYSAPFIGRKSRTTNMTKQKSRKGSEQSECEERMIKKLTSLTRDQDVESGTILAESDNPKQASIAWAADDVVPLK